MDWTIRSRHRIATMGSAICSYASFLPYSKLDYVLGNASGNVFIDLKSKDIYATMYFIDAVAFVAYALISLTCYAMIFREFVINVNLQQKKVEARLALLAFLYVTYMSIIIAYIVFIITNHDINKYVIIYDAIVDFTFVTSPFLTLMCSSVIRKYFVEILRYL